MKFILAGAAFCALTSSALATSLEERVERLEKVQYLANAAFLLGGVKNCGVPVNDQEVRAFFREKTAGDTGLSATVLSNATIGALYSTGERRDPAGSEYCSLLRSSLSAYGLSGQTHKD